MKSNRGLSTCAALIACIALAPAASTALAATPNTWTAVHPMNTGRNSHVAALLPGGKVLVAGGSPDGSSCLTSAEIYDPAHNTWTAAAPMGTARCDASAVTLASGKVLVVGGGTNATNPASALATGEVYNPSTNSWTAVANSMSSARYLEPAAVAMPNGKVLIAGGLSTSSSVASADVYNPATNTFSPTSSMGTPRGAPVGVLLSTGNVLVAGGVAGHGDTPLSTGEVYNPTSAIWTPVKNDTSQPRDGAGGAALAAGRALIAGGITFTTTASGQTGQSEASTDLYSAATNSFTPGPAMSTARSAFGIAPLPGGRVVVAGGVTSATIIYSPFSETGTVTSSSEVYDSTSNAWKPAGSLPSAVAGLVLVPLPSGEVLSSGGAGSDLHTGSNEAALFTPAPVPEAKPRLHFVHLHKRLKRQRLLRGLKFTIKANEPVTLRISLLGRRPGAKKFKLTLAKKTLSASTAGRKISLRPKRSRLGHRRHQVIELVIVASNAQGTSSTTIRKITISG